MRVTARTRARPIRRRPTRAMSPLVHSYPRQTNCLTRYVVIIRRDKRRPPRPEQAPTFGLGKTGEGYDTTIDNPPHEKQRPSICISSVRRTFRRMKRDAQCDVRYDLARGASQPARTRRQISRPFKPRRRLDALLRNFIQCACSTIAPARNRDYLTIPRFYTRAIRRRVQVGTIIGPNKCKTPELAPSRKITYILSK